ncbi:ER membrane complex subunit 3 [Ascosphaera acerosa]|nr:ER membrane complex subunit 3 [Ascosphaera acerosa]
MSTRALVELLDRLRPRFHIDPCTVLPPEVVALVFAQLDVKSLLACALVSHSWRNRALQSAVWRQLYQDEGWGFNFEAVGRLEEELAAKVREEHAKRAVDKTTQQHADSDLSPCISWGDQNESIEADTDDFTASATDGTFAELDAPLNGDTPSHCEHEGSPRVDLRLTRHPFTAAYIFNARTLRLELNWYKLYRLRHGLEAAWKHGRATAFTLPSPAHLEEGHKDLAYTLQQQGKWLVSGSRDTTIAVWDMDCKRRRGALLRGHEQSVLCVQFDPAPEQDVIISGGSDCSVIVWRFSTGQLLHRIRNAHADSVLNLAFDARWLLTCSKDQTIRLWNRRRITAGDVDDTLLDPAFASSSSTLSPPSPPLDLSPALVALRAGEIGHIEPYTCIYQLRGHTAAVNALQLHGTQLTSASGDRTIRVWDLPSGRCLRVYRGHTKGIACVQAGSRAIVSGSNDATVRIFACDAAPSAPEDGDSNRQVACLTGHRGLVRTVQAHIPASCDLRGSGSTASTSAGAASSEDTLPDDAARRLRSVQLTDHTRTHEAVLAASTSSPPHRATLSQHARIVSGSYDGTVRIWTRDEQSQWRETHCFTVASVLRGTSQHGHRSVSQQLLHTTGRTRREREGPGVIGAHPDAPRVFKVQFDACRLIVANSSPIIVGLEFGISDTHDPDWDAYRFFAFFWIVVPITCVMEAEILTGLLRHYATVLMNSPPKPPTTLVESRERQVLLQAVNLRNNAASVLSPAAASMRKRFFVNGFKDGSFLKDPESRGQGPPNPMADPQGMDQMMGMLKGNMMMMIPQTVIMGFVILRLPFPLTIRFKSMLQSGVMTKDLDVRWVSSLSWYFLNLFGLQPVFSFLLGSETASAMAQQQMTQMNPAAGVNPFGPGQDPDKMFLAEAENLEVMDHFSILDGIEERLLHRLAFS